MMKNVTLPPSPGKSTFIPKMLAMSVSGKRMTLAAVRIQERVVQPVRQHGFVRRLEPLDDFLVVLERVQIRSAASEMSSK